MAKAKKAVALKKDKARKYVKELIAEISNVNAKEIKENANIKNDLDIDSLASVEILAAIEKRLGIIIDESKAFNIVTVKDLIELVMFYLKDKSLKENR